MGVSKSPAVYVKRQRTPLRSLTETLETTKVRYETMNTRSHSFNPRAPQGRDCRRVKPLFFR